MHDASGDCDEPEILPPMRKLVSIVPPLVMQGPISIVGERVAIGTVDVLAALVRKHAESRHETPGGDCRDCGTVRLIAEFYGS